MVEQGTLNPLVGGSIPLGVIIQKQTGGQHCDDRRLLLMGSGMGVICEDNKTGDSSQECPSTLKNIIP